MSWTPSDDYEYHNTATTMEFEWGKDYELVVEATIEWKFEGFDGIGSYEYWGAKGYDQGSPNWDIDTVTITVFDTDGNEITLPKEEHEALYEHICHKAEPDFD